MSCCGMKRASQATTTATPTSRLFTAARPAVEALRPAVASPPPPAPAPARSPGVAIGTVRLRYLARTAVLVRGAASGANYRFSANQPVQAVQRSDADALVATGHFRREG